MNNSDIYEKVIELCDEKDISQRQLCRDLEFAIGTISKWKTSTPKLETLQAVADYFNVTTDYLTGRTKYRNKDHMLQSFDKNIDLEKLLDGNTEIPVDYCIQTEEGIMLIEGTSAAPKYIDPATRKIAESIQANEQLKDIMEYISSMPKSKFDAFYNMIKAFDNENE